ncbi:hypothetical protein DSO57_1004471 [Entomophthora muscae]|uniref:Uncharacterized protein n=1 Tax=Entomophthora muscae TaxID=34485 RepID=A0ACC2UI34_9FUNG|nr:hypothetical protein DSO57_1004471 [Entomophthora muscae]
MEPPVTSKPMPASLSNLPTDHPGKLFGIVYITLTGLAPLLWWALPAKLPAQVTPENNGLATQVWIPDTEANIIQHNDISEARACEAQVLLDQSEE